MIVLLLLAAAALVAAQQQGVGVRVIYPGPQKTPTPKPTRTVKAVVNDLEGRIHDQLNRIRNDGDDRIVLNMIDRLGDDYDTACKQFGG